ncbi:MAG: WD40 repeat domain-containing protein, partial [Roseiflexaceae bacterium]
ALLLILSESSIGVTVPAITVPKQPIADIAAQKQQFAPTCFNQQLASAGTPPIAIGVPVAAANSTDSHDLAKSGRLIARWEVQTQVTHVAFSPDSQTFATALADGTIQLWPSSGGKPLRTLCLPDDGAPSVVGLTFLNAGETLAAASAGGRILFWQVQDGALTQEIDLGKQAIMAIAFAPDGQSFAASVDKGTTVKIFGRDTSTPTHTIVWNANRAVNLIFSPDSQMLAVGEEIGYIRLIEVNSTKEPGGYPVPTGNPPSLAFSPDSQTLAVGLVDGTAEIWQVHGAVRRTLAGKAALPVYPAFAADGQMLALARMDGKVDLWDVGDGTLLRTLDGGPTKGHASLSFSPDGRTLIVAWEAGTIELWGLPL